MIVTSRLRIRGIENAFMVQDAEVSYPIFATSLHSEKMFNQMVESGYQFCGIPFDFRKDGMSIMSLPVQDFTPSYEEELDMYDADAMPKMSTEYLRSKLVEDYVRYIEEPPTNYIYTTREEFLEYLRGTTTGNVEEVHVPINYFVAPSARFTVEEWRSGEYEEYFRMIENRRHMSYIDYVKLRNWLKQFNPKVADRAGEFIDAYYAWGIDGVNLRFISKKRTSMYMSTTAAAMWSADEYTLKYSDVALVDRYGATFPPTDVAIVDPWKVYYQGGKEDPAFRAITANLKDNEYGICKMKMEVGEDCVVLQSLKDTFTISPYKIVNGVRENINFVITTFDAAPTVVNARWWAERWDNRVQEMSRLRAIANSIVMQRRRNADVSSFKALQYVGLDIRGALYYIIEKTNNTSEEDIDGVTQQVVDDTIPTKKDIDDYCEGTLNRDTAGGDDLAKLDFIEGIIRGDTNVDRTQDGAMADKAIDVSKIYQYLYALHFCKSAIPIEVLSKLAENTDTRVSEYTDNYGRKSDVIRVDADNGFVLNIPCPLLNAKVEGYNADILSYKVRMSDECSCFCKVINVAREYGMADQTRHVAFEGAFVKLLDGTRRTIANANLDRLIKEFTDAVAMLPGYKQKYLLPYKRSTCMREYFRVAEQGYMLLGEELGNRRVDFPPEFVESVRSTVVNEITSTAVYSRRLYIAGHFTHMCVNADITPYQVYPLNMVELPEVHVRALWEDLPAVGAVKIDTQLRQGGFLYDGFLAWTYRYVFGKHFKDISDMPADVDLCRYVHKCIEFCGDTKVTEQFIRCPHIESFMYAGLDPEDERIDMGTPQRTGRPPVVLSKARMISKSSFPEHGMAKETAYTQVDTIKKFTGFNTEDFDMIPNIYDVKFPGLESTDRFIVVEEDGTISTESNDKLPYYSVEQMEGKGYPVVRLWGRRYLLRDIYGSLWEVTS